MSNTTNDNNNFDKWNSKNYKKVNKFSLKGIEMICLCVKVYDGDTITVMGRTPLFKNNKLHRYNIRIDGLDTPEIRGAKSPKEKAFAIVVRDYLRSMILDQIVTIKFKKFGKYGGRTLGKVYFEDLNITKHLISMNYAYAYDGGTKRIWFPEEVERIKKLKENSHDFQN
jgi:endonuclease YncB( thermonuclease family)